MNDVPTEHCRSSILGISRETFFTYRRNWCLKFTLISTKQKELCLTPQQQRRLIDNWWCSVALDLHQFATDRRKCYQSVNKALSFHCGSLHRLDQRCDYSMQAKTPTKGRVYQLLHLWGCCTHNECISAAKGSPIHFGDRVTRGYHCNRG